MSGGLICRCPGSLGERMRHWRLLQYRCNHSAFSGYHWTTSAYSEVTCERCHRRWRTRAVYVEKLMVRRS